MADRLMGVETEYAFCAHSSSLGALDQAEFVNRLLILARQRLVHLPDLSGGIFLENGSRFYVDCGSHPELATPECANPTDVVRYVLAGERILAKVSEDLERQFPYARVALFKSNVDYGGAWTTWGCHESYSHAALANRMSDDIIPHLVTRIIYTGAGGFDPTSKGLMFTLSPRVFHLANVVSNNSTSERGIFHTKDESLSRPGLHRLHIICGESLCSQTAMWLKSATTALIVAMVEAGLRPGAEVALRSPIEAMRAIANDPECAGSVELLGGRRLNAIEIQHHYLTIAERYVGRAFMPSWAEEACRLWRSILTRLREAPGSVSATLDWAIKRALYEEYAKRRGIAWESLPRWTRVLTELIRHLECTDEYEHPLTAEFALGKQSPLRPVVFRLTPYLEEGGLKWDMLDPVIALRNELFEADTRFGQLGGAGIFARLDEAGVLAHQVPGVDRLDAATTEPPAKGRALVRGSAIKRLAQKEGCYQCDWQGVFDVRAGRLLDLSEPFESQERWVDFDQATPEATWPYFGFSAFRDGSCGVNNRRPT